MCSIVMNINLKKIYMNAHAMQCKRILQYIFILLINLYQSYKINKNTHSDRYRQINKQTGTHTTVVLNSDRRVGRLFAAATVGDTLCCKELARRLGGG